MKWGNWSISNQGNRRESSRIDTWLVVGNTTQGDNELEVGWAILKPRPLALELVIRERFGSQGSSSRIDAALLQQLSQNSGVILKQVKDYMKLEALSSQGNWLLR